MDRGTGWRAGGGGGQRAVVGGGEEIPVAREESAAPRGAVGLPPPALGVQARRGGHPVPRRASRLLLAAMLGLRLHAARESEVTGPIRVLMVWLSRFCGCECGGQAGRTVRRRSTEPASLPGGDGFAGETLPPSSSPGVWENTPRWP